MELIKQKRKLRREKSRASANSNPQEVQSIQRQMNVVGGQIKKEQKKEERLRHETACRKLVTEKDPKKFFQSVRTLTCTDEGETMR